MREHSTRSESVCWVVPERVEVIGRERGLLSLMWDKTKITKRTDEVEQNQL